VVSYRGRWYVVGLDTDRGAERLFRLSRVQGEVRRDGRPGSFDVPEGTDVHALANSLAPEDPSRTSRMLVRHGAALGLRRHGRVCDADAPDDWDMLEVPFGRTEALADEVLGSGADVVVEEPLELRELVVERLRTAAGVAS
jgi:predicted DNA-binding transcriptional regulator YafY